MGRTTQPFVSAKIGSRPQNKSRRDDAAVPAVSSRTSFARCSNFLLSQKRSDTTVIADRASPGGLGMSGSGWSRQGRTNGTSESFLCPFGTLDPGVGRHVQATQDVNSLYPRTVPDSSDCRLEGQVDPSTNWSGVRVYVVCKLFKTLLEGFAVRRGRSLCLLCSPLWYRQWERRTWMVGGAETCEVMVSTDC